MTTGLAIRKEDRRFQDGRVDSPPARRALRVRAHKEYPAMAVGTYEPTRTDWVQSVLFDRGYLARIRGEAIKVYLVMIEACGGLPDRSVTISLSQLTQRTRLSCPTVIDSLGRLEDWGWSSRPPINGARSNLLRRRPPRHDVGLSGRPAGSAAVAGAGSRGRTERRVVRVHTRGKVHPGHGIVFLPGRARPAPLRVIQDARRLGDQGLPGHRPLLRLRHRLGLSEHPDHRPPGGLEPADRARPRSTS